MIDRRAADSFWHVVRACLMTFHEFSDSEAGEKSMALRERIEAPPAGMSSDIFYHAEPFDVACDIAGKPRDLSECREQYDTILREHRW